MNAIHGKITAINGIVPNASKRTWGNIQGPPRICILPWSVFTRNQKNTTNRHGLFLAFVSQLMTLMVESMALIG